MWPSQRTVWSDQRGIVLVMVLMIVSMLSVLALAFSTMVGTDVLSRAGSAQMREGFYAAEAGLNIGMTRFTPFFANARVPSGSDFAEQTATVGTRTVYYQLSPTAVTGSCSDVENPNCYIAIAAGEKFAGVKSIPTRYSVDSTSENSEGDEETYLGAQFEVHTIPLFQFLAFYAGDLELSPDATMNLHGRLHTNGNLYLSTSAGGAGLTFSDSTQVPNVQLSAKGSIFHYRKHTTSCPTGTVTIDGLLDESSPSNSYDPVNLPNCSSGALSQTTLDSYRGSILAGTNEIVVPTADVTQRDTGQYWTDADLRIVLNLSATRAQVDFSGANYCPGGPTGVGNLRSPKLYPIEVWDTGGKNTTKTNQLLKFICLQRGAIFYNDVPNSLAAPADTVYAATAANYTPPFGDLDASDTVTPGDSSTANSNAQVYRRVGVDTGGNGVIDRDGNGAVTDSDRNTDICPYGSPGTRPFWMPDFCGDWAVVSGITPTSTTWFYNTDYRRGGFYNRREGKWVYMLNVNLRALIEWNASNSDPLFSHSDATNGGLVIFLSVKGPYSTTAPASNPVRYGVRVFDSADLDIMGNTLDSGAADPTGLTVVSDQAVYIEGNYNYTDKVPAAVIGDTINVLSQSWEVRSSATSDPANDRKTTASLATTSLRNVFNSDGYNYAGNNCGTATCQSFTTSSALGINAALVGGVDVSTSGTYNGGLENYLRLHENWGGKTLNFKGSFVSLGAPKYANGTWSNTETPSTSSTVPTRAWDFDPDFADVKKLPPLPLKGIYMQQKTYTRFAE